jgi:hypothetical protein
VGYTADQETRLLAEAFFIETLITGGILTPVITEEFRAQAGSLIFSCADGDQMHDLHKRHHGHCENGTCQHWFSTNGLGLKLAKNSPVATAEETALWWQYAREAVALKELKAITIYGHWPCGIAVGASLPVFEQMDLYVKAKLAMRNIKFEAVVSVEIHIDHRFNQNIHGAPPFKGIYHLNRALWEEKRSSYIRQLDSHLIAQYVSRKVSLGNEVPSEVGLDHVC